MEKPPPFWQAHNNNKNEIDRIETELSAAGVEAGGIGTLQRGSRCRTTTCLPTITTVFRQSCRNRKAAYDLTWKGEGRWSGYTYLRGVPAAPEHQRVDYIPQSAADCPEAEILSRYQDTPRHYGNQLGTDRRIQRHGGGGHHSIRFGEKRD